jgi:Fic-DOC domain mobile mystery protein B
MNLDYAPGATPLHPDEFNGLIPTHITTKGDLNVWEQANILDAELWLINRKIDLLSEKFLKELHYQMFNKTWKWAGQFRKTQKNIGIDWIQVPTALHTLLDDVKYHIQNATYDPIEIAVRFHHRLVAIHLFPNGNGRHARLACDMLCISLNLPRPTWGDSNLVEANVVRERYISALRAADNHDYLSLLEFVSER